MKQKREKRKKQKALAKNGGTAEEHTTPQTQSKEQQQDGSSRPTQTGQDFSPDGRQKDSALKPSNSSSIQARTQRRLHLENMPPSLLEIQIALWVPIFNGTGNSKDIYKGRKRHVRWRARLSIPKLPKYNQATPSNRESEVMSGAKTPVGAAINEKVDLIPTQQAHQNNHNQPTSTEKETQTITVAQKNVPAVRQDVDQSVSEKVITELNLCKKAVRQGSKIKMDRFFYAEAVLNAAVREESISKPQQHQRQTLAKPPVPTQSVPNLDSLQEAIETVQESH